MPSGLTSSQTSLAAADLSRHGFGIVEESKWILIIIIVFLMEIFKKKETIYSWVMLKIIYAMVNIQI